MWVEVLDPQGRNPKSRPAVVVTPTGDIRPDGEIVVAAVTSRVEQSPPAVTVELPWQHDGHPRTKLNRRAAVVCTWLVTVPASAVETVGGMVPFAQLARILEVIRSLERESEPDPLPQPGSDP